MSGGGGTYTKAGWEERRPAEERGRKKNQDGHDHLLILTISCTRQEKSSRVEKLLMISHSPCPAPSPPSPAPFGSGCFFWSLPPRLSVTCTCRCFSTHRGVHGRPASVGEDSAPLHHPHPLRTLLGWEILLFLVLSVDCLSNLFLVLPNTGSIS